MRSSTIRAEQLPLEVQQQIDACCDKFESALQLGQSPTAVDFVRGIPELGKSELRRELAAIELAYQRTLRRGGQPPQQSCQQIPHQGHNSEGLHLRCPHCQNQVELLDDVKLEEITCNSCGDTFSLIDEEAEGSVARRVSHFELLERLGTGGFGTVWKARDTELDRLVAIKLPRKSQLSARETEQFFREARTAAQLKHPNIVPVHEVGKEDGTIFIVTDLIEGVPLSEWLKKQTASPQATAQWCATLAEALAYAHGQGVIHRDLKPSNVMLDEKQQPHIMDFGLAKRELGEITMTLDGTVLGTPAYMSPEQALGESHWIDRRTDIYSLGVMLFQMLTQELPYRGTAQQQIQQRVVDDAPDPRKLNAHVPLDLATICLKCLERSANRRYATVGELAAELRRYLAGEPIRSRPISALQRAGRWAKRKPALATATALTCVLAIAGPLAAVAIEHGRRTIEKQLEERDGLIERKVRSEDELNEQLGTLRNDLKRFQEHNPDRVALADWRERLIADFVEQRQTERIFLLEASFRPPDGEEAEQLIRSNLGWTYLLRANGNTKQALEHVTTAQRLAKELWGVRPASLPLRQLLAHSLQEMSELQSQSRQHEAARQSATAALEIRKSLAAEHPDQLAYQIDEFESQEWQLAKQASEAASSDAKSTALTHWQVAKNNLQKRLATSSEDFYTLACHLTLRVPELGNHFSPVTAGELSEQNKIE